MTSPTRNADPAATALPGQHWTQLELPDDADGDSVYSDNSASTASIRSSILQYRTIMGRTFHSDHGNAKYWAANDETQNESLDFRHHVLMTANDDKLYMSPIDENKDKSQAVLDIGTGTGIWAIDFADEHPNATVIGTDISPIQPLWVPPNLKFQIDDCTQEWTFQPDSFDFVHVRWLVGSVVDWVTFYKEAFKVLKPGGYLESNEASGHIVSDDGSVVPTSAMSQWCNIFIDVGKKTGRSFTVFEDDSQRKGMEAAGFVDIKVHDFKIPLSDWPADTKQKQLGLHSEYCFLLDLEGMLIYVGKEAGWTQEEVFAYAAHMRREFKSKKAHPYFWGRVVYGRKPLDA